MDEPVLCLHLPKNVAKNQFYIVSYDTLLQAACHKNT